MEIIKGKISDKHDNGMFYTDVLAYGKAKNGNTYILRSEGEAEIFMSGKHFYKDDIEKLGKNMTINDDSVDDHNYEGISVLVDGWLVISKVDGMNFESILYDEDQDEDRIFGYYDEAIKGFETFLNK